MLKWIEEHRWETATVAPVWQELRFGCSRLPPSATMRAEWHAEERARLTGEGRTPAFVDGQIAAVAAVHQLAVVTLNASHFRPFDGLKIEEIPLTSG